MITRVAGTPPEVTPEEESLITIDTALDRILISIKEIGENFENVTPQNPEEEAAKKKIMDLFETAINPYFADVMDSWNVFEGE